MRPWLLSWCCSILEGCSFFEAGSGFGLLALEAEIVLVCVTVSVGRAVLTNCSLSAEEGTGSDKAGVANAVGLVPSSYVES